MLQGLGFAVGPLLALPFSMGGRMEIQLVELSDEEILVLRESVFHSTQRADVSDDDRRHLHNLYHKLLTSKELAEKWENFDKPL